MDAAKNMTEFRYKINCKKCIASYSTGRKKTKGEKRDVATDTSPPEYTNSCRPGDRAERKVRSLLPRISSAAAEMEIEPIIGERSLGYE